MDNPNAVTFDFIWGCWKEGKYPDGFDDSLEGYLDGKMQLFGNMRVDDIRGWLKRTLIALEIGVLRDPARFGPIKAQWRSLLDRDWTASIEDQWVEWA